MLRAESIMRINVHAHVFNIRSVFTDKTISILLNRLGAEGWPDFVVKAVEAALRKLLKGDYFDEQTLMAELAGQLNGSALLKKYLAEAGDAIPGDVQILAHGNIDDLLAGGLRDLLHKLGDYLSKDEDISKHGVQDLLAFLLIGIKHSILEVTDKLMEASGEDAVATALMMDITDGKGRDEGLFTRQINDTGEAALMYPGRLLPFVAVNTLRSTHFQHMIEALEKKGFAGVKLYPSLGFSVQSPEMDKVFTYCEANEIPVLLHCNRGGFKADSASVKFCDPADWIPVLEAHPKLRVCFGHFGGDENFSQPNIPANGWAATILSLMEEYDEVYADISYHTDCMDGGANQVNYFNNLSSLLAQKKYRDRILFGTDFFLVRQRCREENYWSYYQMHFKAEEWDRLTRANPARFLGLTGDTTADGLDDLGDGSPNQDGGPRANILNYLRWLVVRAQEVGRVPSPWVLDLIELHVAKSVKWLPNPFGTRWTDNNDAHYYAAIWLNSNLRPEMTVNGDFVRLGSRLVRDLKDYPPESRPANERAAKIRGLASDLYVYLVTPQPKGGGATVEEGVSQAGAKNALARLFADGNLQLQHFGPAVDGILHFGREALPDQLPA
jgi:predicted TIM-barrel fold metal-dependent hydrolase